MRRNTRQLENPSSNGTRLIFNCFRVRISCAPTTISTYIVEKAKTAELKIKFYWFNFKQIKSDKFSCDLKFKIFKKRLRKRDGKWTQRHPKIKIHSHFFSLSHRFPSFLSYVQAFCLVFVCLEVLATWKCAWVFECLQIITLAGSSKSAFGGVCVVCSEVVAT